MKISRLPPISFSLLTIAAAAGVYMLSGVNTYSAFEQQTAADTLISQVAPQQPALQMDTEVGSLSIEFREGQTRLTKADLTRLDTFSVGLGGDVAYEVHGKEPQRLSGKRARGIAFERAFEARTYLAGKGIDPRTGRIFFHTKAPGLTPGLELKQADAAQSASRTTPAKTARVAAVGTSSEMYGAASMRKTDTELLSFQMNARLAGNLKALDRVQCCDGWLGVSNV